MHLQDKERRSYLFGASLHKVRRKHISRKHNKKFCTNYKWSDIDLQS